MDPAATRGGIITLGNRLQGAMDVCGRARFQLLSALRSLSGLLSPLRNPIIYGFQESAHLWRTFQARKIERMARARVSCFHGGKGTWRFGTLFIWAMGHKSLENYFVSVTVVVPRTRTAPVREKIAWMGMNDPGSKVARECGPRVPLSPSSPACGRRSPVNSDP